MTPRKAPVLRASWLATALAGVLAVSTPVTASIVGARAVNELHASTSGRAPGAGRGSGSIAPRPRSVGHAPVRAADRNVDEETGRERERSSARPEVPAGATEAPSPPANHGEPHLLVRVPGGGLTARRNPWNTSPVVGTVVASSRYYHVHTVAWIEELNAKGTWGRVELPYIFPRRDGWVHLAGLRRETTWVSVKIDLSEHRVTVWKMGRVVMRTAGATGAPSSPTPPGEYFVTDRVPFWAGSALGSFAFGISGVQPNLPAGWSGGDQLAIHGTNAPWSIGTSASAGCVRVSEATLARLRPLLALGTPVIIVR